MYFFPVVKKLFEVNVKGIKTETPLVLFWQNLSSCLWLFFNQVPGRLYLELQFFCAVANYGQVASPGMIDELRESTTY